MNTRTLIITFVWMIMSNIGICAQEHWDAQERIELNKGVFPKNFSKAIDAIQYDLLGIERGKSHVKVIDNNTLYINLSFSKKESLRLPYQTNPSLLFRGDYSTSGVLRQFPHGMLFGSGGQTSVPGIGRFNNASLGYQHAFNQRLTLQLGVDAMKINMIHSTGQAFSTSGALRYQASDRVAFKVFGSYAIGNTYGMDTHRYGATMSLDMSERFGMEVGVQRYYDAYRGRWETVPVVIPYYNFDKFKLSLDVGGILYEILRNTVFDNRGGSGGATIAPPRFQMPPLR